MEILEFIFNTLWAIVLLYCLCFSFAFFIISKLLDFNVRGNTEAGFNNFAGFPIHIVKSKNRIKKQEMMDDKMRNNMI